WLQSGGCGGCSMALTCAEAPGLYARLAAFGIELLWHPSLSQASGSEVIALLEAIAAGERPLDCLCIEGALLRGPHGSGRFHVLGGTGVPTIDWVRRLAARAQCTVAVGSCAVSGGFSACAPNPTEACGLQFEDARRGGALGPDWRSPSGLPVIALGGCAVHPDWVLETLAALALGELDAGGLDAFGRPRAIYERLVHHGCPRNEYYEYKASAEKPSDLGCLMEHLGCRGTQAHADCNERVWNGGGSCTRAGFACIDCVAPGFQNPGHAFQRTPKLGGIPVGLPTDMPKAWFVALASLAKAATPARVRENAVADHPVVPPKMHVRKP
ncbi:MAG TPA: HupU protein, partial [Plasticicumulans sp.]|nr:HupU protein [Plasticicumulans sp.]